MKIKNQDPRSTWRDRFLEIAREVESGRGSRALLAGLRQRPRISAGAGRRVRILAAQA